ncbi:MAG: Type 1 glutamine amidotransferase-like domain-containing protein [Schaedlerella sp.]|nr:Type 1 glutamine amidotransferase-like domain-containing protein [Schaedlerella sp.]
MITLYMTSSPTGDYRSDKPPAYPGLNPANGLIEELKKDWRKDSRCLIIAATPDAHELNDEMREFFEKKFRATELSVKDMKLCDDRNDEEITKDLSEFDMIILGGGHVPTQNAFFQKIRLKEKLRKFDGIVMGISAGTMNCAEVVYAQPELPGESISKDHRRFIYGLGLTKMMILPHYQAVKDDMLDGRRLFEEITYPDSIGRKFYALVDGSYILQRNGKEKVCGKAYLIQNGTLSRYMSGE